MDTTHWPLEQPNSLVTDMARNREHALIEHLSTVRFVARSIHKRLPQHVDINDLVNSGVIGLMDAFQKFDPEKLAPFGSFARFRIRGAILDYLRSLDWSPRRLRQKQRSVEQARHALTGRYRQFPTDSEVATELKMELCEFQGLLGELNNLAVGSLNDTFPGGSGEDRLSNLPGRSEENPLVHCLRAEVQQSIFDAIDLLSERERLVIRLYYTEEMTMNEIGLRLGVVVSRISQILSSAVRHLRPALCDFHPSATKNYKLQMSKIPIPRKTKKTQSA